MACLPGTHTKWVQVSAGEVVSFRTCMTGEMFALLSERSVLRHSVAAEGLEEDAFEDALMATLARPEALAAGLFGLRAEGLLEGTAPGALRSRLSGLLIGAELAATRPLLARPGRGAGRRGRARAGLRRGPWRRRASPCDTGRRRP